MGNALSRFLESKIEMVVITLISLIIIAFMIYYNTYVIGIFIMSSLNSIILNVFGVLFGLLFTSYAILFGLVPAFSLNTLKTDAINSVNTRFFLGLLLNLTIIMIGISIYFTQGITQIILIYLELFIVIYSLLLFLALISYLFLLFKDIRNTAIKRLEKN